jgi:transposase
MSLRINASSIWVGSHAIDFRCSIDGLCRVVIESFGAKPQEGLYVFYNKRRNRLKLLVWHYNGFVLLYKRLEKGKFPFEFSAHPSKIALQEKQLQGLLLGLDWQVITSWEDINFESFF